MPPRKRTGAKASIGLVENEAVTLHSDAVLIAQNEGRTVRSVDTLDGHLGILAFASRCEASLTSRAPWLRDS